jgi:hypothetical protein
MDAGDAGRAAMARRFGSRYPARSALRITPSSRYIPGQFEALGLNPE